MLEDEIRVLRQELSASVTPASPNAPSSSQAVLRDSNALLDYLKSLEPHNLQQLTSSAGEDVVEAMHQFVGRLMGTKDPAQLKQISSDTTAQELSQLLFWLLVVGYSLRTMEIKLDLDRAL